MRYFTVRVENARRHMVREIDVPARELLGMFRELEDRLRRDGIFANRDDLLKRIVPHTEAVETIQTRVFQFEQDAAVLGGLEFDVYFNGMDRAAGNPPLNSLSLWFYSVKSSRVCSVTLPVSDVFRAVEDELKRQILTESAPSEEGEEWVVQVFLSGDGLLFIPRKHQSKMLAIILPADLKLSIEGERDHEVRPVDVKVTERKALVVPSKRSWNDYDARRVGSHQHGDLRILIGRRTSNLIWSRLAEINGLAEEGRVLEVGGFLLGNVFMDEEEKIFIDIESFAVVNLELTLSFTSLLKYYPDTLQQTTQKIKEMYPDMRRLGWYHAHLIPVRSRNEFMSPQAISQLDFSIADRELHSSMFREPWQVALVIDIAAHQFNFYQWKRNELEPCSGYYEYES